MRQYAGRGLVRSAWSGGLLARIEALKAVTYGGRPPPAVPAGEWKPWDRTRRDSIRPVADEDSLAAGGAASRLADPNDVRVEYILNETELFRNSTPTSAKAPQAAAA
ncbi:hypothetical protein [Streptomyces sp. NPDC026589]|uniref:hypothetical protein n=1 Tax=Streptomyces sp. NPDC026589 TaxID=3155609 RepID=UPI0033CECFBA